MLMNVTKIMQKKVEFKYSKLFTNAHTTQVYQRLKCGEADRSTVTASSELRVQTEALPSLVILQRESSSSCLLKSTVMSVTVMLLPADCPIAAV